MAAGQVKEEDLIGAFQTINEDIAERKDILDKCLSICHQYILSSNDLANHWDAFVMNQKSDSSQLSITLASLDSLASHIAKKSSASTAVSASSTRKERRLSSSTPSMIPTPFFTKDTIPRNEADFRKRLSMEGGLEGIGTPASQQKKMMSFKSPEGVSEGPAKFSPAGLGLSSPSVEQSSPSDAGSSYINRTNAGQKISDMNPGLGTRGAFLPSARAGGFRCDITVLEDDENINLTNRYRHMYTTLEERSRALEQILITTEKEMTNSLPLADVTTVGIPKQDPITIIGRVCCEAPEGRINKTSVILEGSRKGSGGRRVQLDLSDLKAFALFPGQVVAAHGVNSSGYQMHVTRLFEGVPRPFASTPAEVLQKYHYEEEYQGGGAISMLVAAGPYTINENLDYTPLEDLMKVIAAKAPDVAVLVGPFVDINHPKIASGEVEIAGDENETETVDYENLFKLRVSSLIRGLYTSNPSLCTRLILIPSLNDVFHDMVYPQPPLIDRVPGGVLSPFFEEERIGNLDIPFTDGENPLVYCMSNPAVFKINEVTVGITSNDILFHLSCGEVSHNTGNRMARLAAHLVQQQSFYPLFPPPADGLSQLDLRHADHWRMHITPDVLILPSRLSPFSKDVLGSVCINPGQLSKTNSGGSYAITHIHPIGMQSIAKENGKKMIPHQVAERAFVEILKI